MSAWLAALKRGRESGVLWLLLSAALFLIGAGSFQASGMHHAATLGVGAAIAAVALVIAFR